LRPFLAISAAVLSTACIYFCLDRSVGSGALSECRLWSGMAASRGLRHSARHTMGVARQCRCLAELCPAHVPCLFVFRAHELDVDTSWSPRLDSSWSSEAKCTIKRLRDAKCFRAIKPTMCYLSWQCQARMSTPFNHF